MFRMTVKKCLGDGIVKQMLLEFIATAELCAICFELVIVADNYGVWVYALYLFLLTLWWARVWEIESACPYSEMEKVVEGTQEALKALYVIIAQILGGILIYYYVQLLWSMELTETHRGKVDEECKADLQVSAAVGTFVEGLSTCVCRLASRFLNDSNARFAAIADPFFATMMVVAAFNYSGGYFNPALATSLKAGCEGHTLVEFMVVYWFGACAGAIASIYIYRSDSFKQFTERIKPKTE